VHFDLIIRRLEFEYFLKLDFSHSPSSKGEEGKTTDLDLDLGLDLGLRYLQNKALRKMQP